jgi:predicted nicotinamide N-methyase
VTGTAQQIAALEQSLRRRFRVVETEVEIGGRRISILHPASAEELIDERDFERDERLPYWAELWPSARVLAERLVAVEGDGRRLLELGCGAGLVAKAAACAGFRVTATDYYEDATSFARINVWRNTGSDVATMMLDWRRMPADLRRFELVLASDVLYERPYGELVAGAIARVLAPSGVAMLADPGRVGREPFLQALAGVGLRIRSQYDAAYAEGVIRQTIAIFEIAWASDDAQSQSVL